MAHTGQVVNACGHMAGYYKLSDKDRFVVKAAAWFHDIGYLDKVEEHEKISARNAEMFLQAEGVDADTIAAVKSCIMATRMPQQPANLLEEIICDADLYHLGTDDFAKRNKLLRQEEAALNNKATGKKKWQHNTLQLLESHHYFTDYCRRHLNERKQQHIEKLKHHLKEQESPMPIVNNIPEDTAGQPMDAKPDKKDRPVKRLETLFRICSTNNLRLSNMADTKAHIMITVNSIIISVLLSVMVRNMDKYEYLAMPVILLLAVNLATIIFSMLATKPRLPHGTFTPDDVEQKSVSLLFFGNYYRMSFEDYTAAMTKVMEDQPNLYTNLMRDIYSQGILLSKKYRMLQIAYSVFMYGLIAAVIVFVIVIKAHEG
jgi:predicted metal-dependent HD superfamily phosphohydrolase